MAQYGDDVVKSNAAIVPVTINSGDKRYRNIFIIATTKIKRFGQIGVDYGPRYLWKGFPCIFNKISGISIWLDRRVIFCHRLTL